MKRSLILLTMLLAVATTAIQAQDEPEYRLEIGAGVGTVNYLGDYNASLFGELQPMGAVMAKYKANPHMAVALTVGYGKLQGSSDNAKTWYPEGERYEFSKSLIDVGLRFEYNFWAYGTGKEYRGARRGFCHSWQSGEGLRSEPAHWRRYKIQDS